MYSEEMKSNEQNCNIASGFAPCAVSGVALEILWLVVSNESAAIQIHLQVQELRRVLSMCCLPYLIGAMMPRAELPLPRSCGKGPY
jgi:hypothetical protein